MQPVKVDTTEGTTVILASGVEAGQMLITDGADKLRNGTKVEPRQARPGQRSSQSIAQNNGQNNGRTGIQSNGQSGLPDNGQGLVQGGQGDGQQTLQRGNQPGTRQPRQPQQRSQ